VKIPFRQGIVRIPNGPSWLQATSLTGSTVDLNVAQEPIVITFAHYTGNYLFEEARALQGNRAAWGSDSPGTINGPIPQGQTSYLFWDVDLVSGALGHGWTLVKPVVAATEPPNPIPDMHWFDTTNTRMRVWKQASLQSAGAWVDKIRLFAATYVSNANIVPGVQIGAQGSSVVIGSQVGLDNGEWEHGNLILGSNNKPLKQADKTFVTTESQLIVQQTSGQNVKFDATLVFAQALEPIPSYTLVSFAPDRSIQIAKSSDIYNYVSGMITTGLDREEVGQVITNGVIRNPQWGVDGVFDGHINKPVFCGVTGELRLTPPVFGLIQQVGFVYELDSIYLNLFPPVRIR
jgi:hypothetical protein